MSGGSIAGTVVDARGRAVEEATVMIVAGPEPHPDIAQLTGPDGAFRFDDLAPGRFALLARHPRGAGARGTADVRPGAQATLVLRLAATGSPDSA